jgi:hypothetical protein
MILSKILFAVTLATLVSAKKCRVNNNTSAVVTGGSVTGTGVSYAAGGVGGRLNSSSQAVVTKTHPSYLKIQVIRRLAQCHPRHQFTIHRLVLPVHLEIALLLSQPDQILSRAQPYILLLTGVKIYKKLLQPTQLCNVLQVKSQNTVWLPGLILCKILQGYGRPLKKLQRRLDPLLLPLWFTICQDVIVLPREYQIEIVLKKKLIR